MNGFSGDSPRAANPLRRRGFCALWLSRTVSFTGDGITRTALLLLTAQRGPTAVALVLLAYTVPRFLGPLAGALADRVERRELMRVCELGQALVIAAIAATMPPLPLLLVLVCVASMFATGFRPAGVSSIPALVPAEELTRANALIGTALNFQIALGPALGGLAAGLGSPRLALAIDAGTFAVSAALLSAVPRIATADTAEAPGSVWTSMLQGLRYVRRTPGPRALTMGLTIFVACAALDNVALVFLVENALSGSATAFGLIQACFGAGMLCASVILGMNRRHLSSAVLLVTGLAASAAGSLATAVAPTLLAAGVTQALAGAGNGTENVAVNTRVQRIVPPSMLGRVFGVVATGAQVGNGVAYAAGGPLVAAAGPRTTFLIAGAGSVLGLVILAPALRARPQSPPN